MLLAASPGTAQAQVTITGPAANTVTEGETATYTVSVKGYIPANTGSPTDAVVNLGGFTAEGVAIAGTTAGEVSDLSTVAQNPRSVTFALAANNTDAAVAFSATGTITIQTLQDDDAENERWAFTPTLTGDLDSDAANADAALAAGAPTMLIIDDDETQTYVLALSPASRSPRKAPVSRCPSRRCLRMFKAPRC